MPAGLKASGTAFWRRVTGVYALSESEIVLLTQVCRSLDGIDELEAVLEREGSIAAGAGGSVKTHPHVGELRQQRAALGRLLVQLALPDEDGGTMESVKSRKARRAAENRWRPHNIAKGAGRG